MFSHFVVLPFTEIFGSVECQLCARSMTKREEGHPNRHGTLPWWSLYSPNSTSQDGLRIGRQKSDYDVHRTWEIAASQKTLNLKGQGKRWTWSLSSRLLTPNNSQPKYSAVCWRRALTLQPWPHHPDQQAEEGPGGQDQPMVGLKILLHPRQPAWRGWLAWSTRAGNCNSIFSISDYVLQLTSPNTEE